MLSIRRKWKLAEEMKENTGCARAQFAWNIFAAPRLAPAGHAEVHYTATMQYVTIKKGYTKQSCRFVPLENESTAIFRNDLIALSTDPKVHARFSLSHIRINAGI